MYLGVAPKSAISVLQILTEAYEAAVEATGDGRSVKVRHQTLQDRRKPCQ
jgi:hypothetical protein